MVHIKSFSHILRVVSLVLAAIDTVKRNVAANKKRTSHRISNFLQHLKPPRDQKERKSKGNVHTH